MRISVDKDKIIELYINENLTRKEVALKLGITEKTLTNRLNEYGIKKSTSDRFKNIKKTLLNRYGENYQCGFNEKAKKTMLERYGVEYTAQSPELLQKMQVTMEERYGKKNYVETKEFQDKSSATCVDKYGVEWPCQYPQCVKALFTASGHSNPEENFANLLRKNNIEFEQEFSLCGYRYDFKVGNYLFEINPSVTHNSTFGVFGKDPKLKCYHYNKTKIANENGYHCIHIWDWDNSEKIVKLFVQNSEKIYARKCIIKEVSVKEAKDFINAYHLQNYAKDAIRIGLYYENKLVSIMTFGKPRYTKKYQYELVRFCSSCLVIGGAEKLFKYFLDNYNPESIVSYCDLLKFDGKVYEKLGFSVLRRNLPSRHWYNLKTGRRITDNLLRQRGFDQLFGTNYGRGTNNNKLMLNGGFVEIYDCGQRTYIMYP